MNRVISRRRSDLQESAPCSCRPARAHSSSPLTPGVSTLPEVEARLGQPAMTWKNADGSQQLAFATGPGGTQTFMVFLAPDGKLQRIVGVLNEGFFGLIQPGMSQEQVLRLLGPSGTPPPPTGAPTASPGPGSIVEARTWMQYFDVNFDATTEPAVRNDRAAPVDLRGFMSAHPPCTPAYVDLPWGSSWPARDWPAAPAIRS